MNLQAKGKESFDVLLKDGEIIDPAQGIHFPGSLRGNLLLEPRMVLKAAEIKPAYSRYHIPPLYQ